MLSAGGERVRARVREREMVCVREREFVCVRVYLRKRKWCCPNRRAHRQESAVYAPESTISMVGEAPLMVGDSLCGPGKRGFRLGGDYSQVRKRRCAVATVTQSSNDFNGIYTKNTILVKCPFYIS